MKVSRQVLEAIAYFHGRVKSDPNLRAAFDTIMDHEIDSRISILMTCNPEHSETISAAQDRIKFANSMKNHDDLVKTSNQALQRLDGE